MKRRIPKFKSLQDERRFWQTHDVTEFLSELTPVNVTFRKSSRVRTVQLTRQEISTLQHLLNKLTGTAPFAGHAHRDKS